MSSSLLYRSGRYGVLVVGLLGFVTSVQLACTFSDEPPVAPKKTSPVTDSGPIPDGDSGGTSSGGPNPPNGYGYGYGYGPAGCYGYGYGYTPTFEGIGACH